MQEHKNSCDIDILIVLGAATLVSIVGILANIMFVE